ncbi:hypothetical protein NEFER03_0712 [Nematocida sp. LUAm3]|nr:hypothetical protein NEFER03_0712 [Nematocida sp. LUAm3]KAI5175171.1 hypothetical protein NEFER02_1132 [Nematocida sp. LUAm2]KAI5178157.1 hypothetical protein NEFER01_1335 [Nematocida sp. LUAm1]
MNKWSINPKRPNKSTKAPGATKRRLRFLKTVTLAVIAALIAMFFSDMGKGARARVAAIPWIKRLSENKFVRESVKIIGEVTLRIISALLYVKTMILSVMYRVPILRTAMQKICVFYAAAMLWIETNICARLCCIFSRGKQIAEKVSEKVPLKR